MRYQITKAVREMYRYFNDRGYNKNVFKTIITK